MFARWRIVVRVEFTWRRHQRAALEPGNHWLNAISAAAAAAATAEFGHN